MKRIIIGTLVVILAAASLTGCGEVIREVEVIKEVPTGILQEDYDNVVADLDAANARIKVLEAKIKETEAVAPEPTTLEPAVEEPTFERIVITGSGDKKSPPFTITTDEWVIDWSYVPDPDFPEFAMFGFYVYPKGETLWDVESVMFPSGTSGSTYSYAGPGQYYVEVTTANVESWEIVISPPK